MPRVGLENNKRSRKIKHNREVFYRYLFGLFLQFSIASSFVVFFSNPGEKLQGVLGIIGGIALYNMPFVIIFKPWQYDS